MTVPDALGVKVKLILLLLVTKFELGKFEFENVNNAGASSK